MYGEHLKSEWNGAGRGVLIQVQRLQCGEGRQLSKQTRVLMGAQHSRVRGMAVTPSTYGEQLKGECVG